jgi:hypothetical protein
MHRSPQGLGVAALPPTLFLHAVSDRPPIRWSVWLAAGVVLGLALGFGVGLAKPRIRK